LPVAIPPQRRHAEVEFRLSRLTDKAAPYETKNFTLGLARSEHRNENVQEQIA
jgi:hypothetical protein